MRLPGAYRGLLQAFGRYWGDYGGFGELICSPLLHLSIAISAASYSVWLKSDWVDIPLSLLPNLLGFSLGAYALIFSLADARLLAALNAPQTDGSPSLLRIINATFLHFILIQTVAIIFALSQKSTLILDIVESMPILPIIAEQLLFALPAVAGAFGYWLTIYAIVLLVGAALAAYRLAIMNGKAASRAAAPSQGQPNGRQPAAEEHGPS